MFYNNWIMALTVIATSIIGFALMILIIGKSQKYFAKQQKGLGEINGHLEEMYTGHNVVKVYNARKKAEKILKSIMKNYLRAA